MMITYRKVLKDFEDWKDKTVSDVFSETVSRHPDKPAILFEDQCWTFRELDCFANKVAHFFLDHGLKKGDTVAIFMENCPELIGLCFGLGKIGVRSSLINYNLRETSLLHCLNICHPKAIVYSTSVGKALVAVQGDLDKTLQGNVFSIGENTFVKQSKNLIKEVERVSTEPPPRPKDSSSRGKIIDNKLYRLVIHIFLQIICATFTHLEQQVCQKPFHCVTQGMAFVCMYVMCVVGRSDCVANSLS